VDLAPTPGDGAHAPPPYPAGSHGSRWARISRITLELSLPISASRGRLPWSLCTYASARPSPLICHSQYLHPHRDDDAQPSATTLPAPVPHPARCDRTAALGPQSHEVAAPPMPTSHATIDPARAASLRSILCERMQNRHQTDIDQRFLRPVASGIAAICSDCAPVRSFGGKGESSHFLSMLELTNIWEKHPLFNSKISTKNNCCCEQGSYLLNPRAQGMVLDMDGYVDPYEEVVAEDDSDNPDEDDSNAESNYKDKSFDLLKFDKHRVRNPDDTFCGPFCPLQEEQGYKSKQLCCVENTRAD
jgi:hypothetical protein